MIQFQQALFIEKLFRSTAVLKMKNIFVRLPIYTLRFAPMTTLILFFIQLNCIASVASDDLFRSAEFVSGAQYINDFINQPPTHISTVRVCCEEACRCVLVGFGVDACPMLTHE